MKKILFIGALLGALAVPNQVRAAARDCDANAIMWCGAYSKTEFAYKVVGGDQHNTPQNLQAIYRSFSISIDEMKLATDGYVTKDGRVVLNGKTVATGAGSIGRQYMPGSIKVHGVWLRPTNISFKTERLEAFVYTKDGVFQWAVLKACGNGVFGKAVTKPAPQPKPIPVVPEEVTPEPAPAPAPALPETGMEMPIAAALGTTSVGYSLQSYLRSKKQLANALRHK